MTDRLDGERLLARRNALRPLSARSKSLKPNRRERLSSPRTEAERTSEIGLLRAIGRLMQRLDQ